MSARLLPEAIFARTVLGSGSGLALAHGAGSSTAGTYGPILEGLADRHTVVGIDYPGSGDTPRSTTALLLDDLADQSSPPPSPRAWTPSRCPATPSAAPSPSVQPPATPNASPPSC
ncbi:MULTISPECIES: alpha/beta fold hydrolase [unclassified Streptomyces]|uniref:alpha/beta fold hydrolase n=1 Tax=Streptomyces sp. NPDC127129 TaxID=3345373 RepID=UPI003640BF84